VQVTGNAGDERPVYVEPAGTLDAGWHRAPMWKQLVFSVVFASSSCVWMDRRRPRRPEKARRPVTCRWVREKDLAEAPATAKRLEAEVGSLMEAVRRDVRGKGAHAG
jgi:hypothetical protein